MPLRWNPIPLDDLIAETALPPPGTPLSPEDAKRLAFLYAWQGVGKVSPNPLVGAVLVDQEHRFLAGGAHLAVGSGHAEINALLAAKANGQTAKLPGSTLYVTLEPCAHHGRTPPCAPEVQAQGVKRVVFGYKDPNPLVNGRGEAFLKTHGLEVEFDRKWSETCQKLVEFFVWNILHELPFVGLKVATGLDGVMANLGDQRVWITGERARAFGHFLRLHYDAIAIGANTLIADNPTLGPTHAILKGRNPVKVIVDPQGRGIRSRALTDFNVFAGSNRRVLWITGEQVSPEALDRLKALGSLGGEHLSLPTDGQGVIAAESILSALKKRGITSVLLEGGAGLYAEFLQAGLVNRLHFFQAPKLAASKDPIFFAQAYSRLLGSTNRLRGSELRGDTDLTPLGEDLLIERLLARTPVEPSRGFSTSQSISPDANDRMKDPAVR